MNNTLSGVICIIQSGVLLQLNNWKRRPSRKLQSPDTLLTKCSTFFSFFFVFHRVHPTKAAPAIIFSALSARLFFPTLVNVVENFLVSLHVFLMRILRENTIPPPEIQFVFSFSSVVIFPFFQKLQQSASL